MQLPISTPVCNRVRQVSWRAGCELCLHDGHDQNAIVVSAMCVLATGGRKPQTQGHKHIAPGFIFQVFDSAYIFTYTRRNCRWATEWLELEQVGHGMAGWRGVGERQAWRGLSRATPPCKEKDGRDSPLAQGVGATGRRSTARGQTSANASAPSAHYAECATVHRSKPQTGVRKYVVRVRESSRDA